MSYSPNDPTALRLDPVAHDEAESYRLLSSTRRRILLDVLSELPTPIALEDAAMAVTVREGALEAGGSPSVDDVMITLHHQHLPMLADAGVVDYRSAESTIESVTGLRR